MMRSAAVATGKSSQTIAGDRPPSSSVTGTRLAAAADMTRRPVSLEPVNSKWSNGSELNASPMPPVSSMKVSRSVGKYVGILSISNRVSVREFSLILTIARFPAARIAVSGTKLKFRGKFQGTMAPITPSGCGMTRLRDPRKVMSTDLRWTLIQLLRWRHA